MTDPTRTEHRWLTPGVRGIGAASFLWPPGGIADDPSAAAPRR